jgi:hypothetical protein
MRRGVAWAVGIIGFIALMIFVLGAVSWSPSTEKVDAGPGPLALLNRYLAMEHYLEKRYGCQVDSRFTVDYEDDEALYDVIIMPVEALPLHEDMWTDLEYLLYDDSLVITGFGDHNPEAELPSQYETAGVLKRIGVTALNAEEDGGLDYFSGVAGFGDYSFASYYKPEFAQQPDPEAPYGVAPGFVTLHNLEVFNNDSIGEQDHVILLDQLLAGMELNEGSVVLVVHGRHVASLWSWLAGEGLPALLLTFLLVAVVIWHYAPRFGPILAEPVRGSRELREHFLATSRFFWRNKSTTHLLEPARRPLLETLRRRSGRSSEAELAVLAANLSGLDPDEVHAALFSREINKRTLVSITAVLQKLRQHV